MPRKKTATCSAWGLLVLLCGCLLFPTPSPLRAAPPREVIGPAPAAPESAQPSPQELANLLAGLDLDPDRLATWVNPEGWREYADDLHQTWQRFAHKQLEPMRAWAARELPSPPAAADTVLYPFSGPDVANLLALFPQAPTYLLLALEPVGSLPALQPGDNGPFFRSLEDFLAVLLRLNYFITKDMASELQAGELDGVLPVLLFFLGREQVHILEASYWLLDPDGHIHETPVRAGLKPGSPGIPGVKIVFQRQPGTPPQTLYYFRFNLQDDSWRAHPRFVSFLKEFAPFQTFIKAASYLLFNPQFGDLRHFLLNHSRLVLQTDEGIPFRYFASEQWDRRLYGNYACPIQVFANCFQADLAALYQTGPPVQPLPFVIGYRALPQTSNLLLAFRRRPPNAAPPLPALAPVPPKALPSLAACTSRWGDRPWRRPSAGDPWADADPGLPRPQELY